MIINLSETTSSKISAALLRARRSAGSPAMGMVLTLIIVSDDSEYAGALQASMRAGREHPSRILLVVKGHDRHSSLDAEVRIGEGMPGEVVIVRMHGAVAAHPASVLRPLLLPDSPVVIWWPAKSPTNVSTDELAGLAVRRLTDAAQAARPLTSLRARAEHYLAGDTDLSWTRLTPWRALLAASLDQYPARIKAAVVEAERNNPSADLLAAWMRDRLDVEVARQVTDGPGITAVRMTTAAGDIAITRPDGLLASYTVPGQPERLVALKRRDVAELITEELRRMDADDVYERTVKQLTTRAPEAASKKTAAQRKSTTKKPATKKPATKKPTAKKPTAKTAGSKPGKESQD
ncbi:MAG TPA: glucose-6-phosphate dehydrogenase assembly protein OpcA [Propionibacteriaceae bacterium]